ncbi:MAG: hypothetical protein A2138_22110 [Deltaproteobacteria bacterium RBG_16_71_12]|nr:MAG: hypothetical protein A2138_22110 [Deltaproteobacteria bacterium RBG_16_71_12]
MTPINGDADWERHPPRSERPSAAEVDMHPAKPLARLSLALALAALATACPVPEDPEEEDEHRRRDDDVCEPAAIGCLDEHTAWVCSDDGDEQIEAPCRDDQSCLDGACRSLVCTPDTTICQGNARVLCNETGTEQTVDPCDESTTCEDTGLGCACSMGFCLPRTCEPLAARCVGNAAQICDGAGLRWGDLQECGADGCYGGRCLPETCTPGATSCAGRTLLTCDVDGVGYAETTCEETCGGPDGSAACVALVCTPLSTSCADADTVAQCNQQGTAEVAIDCGVDQRCEGGVCLDDSCVPSCGTRVCGPDPECGTSCGDCEGTCTTAGQCLLPEGPVLSVELSWTPTTRDLDLYVSQSGTICEAASCYYATCTAGDADRPDWDQSGGPSAGDPVLDIQGPADSNPEIARVPLPAGAASYTVGADHYTTDAGAATATIRLYLDDALVSTHTRSVNPNELWSGVTVSWNGTSASANDDGELVAGFACESTAATCTVDAECPAGQACLDGGIFGTDSCVDGCRTSAECGAQQACNGERDCVAASTINGWKQACATLAECGAGFHCDYFTQLCEEECTVGCATGVDCCLRSGGDSCVADPILQLFGNCAP